MIAPSLIGVMVMVAMQPIDFRRGLNGLVAQVAQVASAFAVDRCCDDVFVFLVKPHDSLRCAYWEESGMILVTKWPEAGKFVRPPSAMVRCR